MLKLSLLVPMLFIGQAMAQTDLAATYPWAMAG